MSDAGEQWKGQSFGGLGGKHRQKARKPKPPPPLMVGHWFKVPYGEGEHAGFTWLKVIENQGFKVLMETRWGARLTVDRKLVQSPPTKRRAAPGS